MKHESIYRIAREAGLMDRHDNSDEWFVRSDIDERTVIEFGRLVGQRLVTAETGWLVELFDGTEWATSAGLYHTGSVDLGGCSRATSKPQEARSYATREEAQCIAQDLGGTPGCTWRAVRYCFVAAGSPGQRSGETGVEAAAQEPVVLEEHCLWARNGNEPCPHALGAERRRLHAERDELLAALHVYQHAVESGMVEKDLRAAYEFASAAIAKVEGQPCA